MRWWVRAVLGLVAMVVGAFLLDEAVWTLRGSPVRQVEVQVVTTMELKGHKEDYGTAETQTVPCQASLLPFAGSAAPCWWVERHREVVRRF